MADPRLKMRQMVSLKKKRFQEEGFDLDLACKNSYRSYFYTFLFVGVNILICIFFFFSLMKISLKELLLLVFLQRGVNLCFVIQCLNANGSFYFLFFFFFLFSLPLLITFNIRLDFLILTIKINTMFIICKFF